MIVLTTTGLSGGDPLLASLQSGLAAFHGHVAGPLDLGGGRAAREGPFPVPVRGAGLHVHAAGEASDILWLLRALAAAGIPLTAADRRQGDPLLVLTGPAALPNPEPAAAFFDAILVGESAVVLAGLVEAWTEARDGGPEAVRRAWLASRGVYVPAAYRPVYREDGLLQCIEATPGAPLPVPARWEPPAAAPSPAGRHGLRPIMPGLWGWDYDPRGRPRGVIAVLGAARAPLRLRAGVSLDDANLEKLLDHIAESGLDHVELEFTLGLPGETHVDAEAIVDLIKQLRHRLLRGGRGAARPPEIMSAVTTFSPLPWTPTQWAPLADARDLARRHRDFAKALSKVGNVSLLHDVPKWAYVQALLARGDRRMERLFRLALEASGEWAAACRAWHLNAGFFVSRPRRAEEVFPWDHLDLGIDKAGLREEAGARGLL